MRLRTLTGSRYPATCACGCKSQIPANPEVKVTVDFDTSRPRLTYLPSHAPDAGTWKGNGPAASPAPSNGGNGHATGFTPASALPESTPKVPRPPLASSPAPLALLGSDAAHAEEEASPSPQAGRSWSSGGLTVNAGKFESVRAGYADYSLPGETAEQLGVRVNAVIEADLRAKLALLVRLHREFGIPGPEYLRPTSSAPDSTGAPKGAPVGASPSSPPRVAATLAPPASEGTSPGLRASAVGVGGGTSSTPSRGDPAVADLVRQVESELSDASVRRKRNKDHSPECIPSQPPTPEVSSHPPLPPAAWS